MAQAVAEPQAPTQLAGFDEMAAELLREWSVPGMAIVIVKDGAVIHRRGYGLRDVARGLPVTTDTIFAIGSSSKAFTAMALGLLADGGKLDWETPVKTYIPTFKLYDQFASERMTPLDLLCHRSGMPRHDLMWYNSPRSRKEIFDRLQYLPPNKDFRSLWQYQNLMYLTAGYLVEAISGKTWEEFVRERIFLPLGMANSNLSVDDSQKAADFALPYDEKDDTINVMEFRNIDAVGPAGSINAPISDMTQWLLLHLGKGAVDGERLIAEGQITRMHAPQMVMGASITGLRELPEMPQSSYGLGWFVEPFRGRNMIHHGGNIDGFSAFVAFMPDERIGVVALTNGNGNPAGMIATFAAFDRLLGVEPAPWNERYLKLRAAGKEALAKGKEKSDTDKVQGTSPSHPLDAYTGEYEHPGYGIFSVTLEDGELQGHFNSIDLAMPHYHYDVFELVHERFELRFKATFATGVKGEIAGIAVPLEPSVSNIVFTRVPPKDMLDRATLEALTGEYDLLGAAMTVSLKDEHTLQVSIPGQPDFELAPYRGTEFTVKGLSEISIEFKRDEAGAVTEAVVTQMGRTMAAPRKH